MKFIEDAQYTLGRWDIEHMNPEYAILKKVEGGWMLFTSYDEYRVWKAQK